MAGQFTGFDEGCTVSQQLGDVGVPPLRAEVGHSVHRNVPGHPLLVRTALRESQQHGEQQEGREEKHHCDSPFGHAIDKWERSIWQPECTGRGDGTVESPLLTAIHLSSDTAPAMR